MPYRGIIRQPKPIGYIRMSGTFISLAPAVNDISVGLLNGLLGQGWESLATGGSPSGAGVLIAQLLAVLNVSLLGFISALILWQTTIGAMATAHEGTPLGKRYHSIWAPIRAPLSFLMVTPLPMAKGLSLLQVTLLFCVHMSIGVADSVWTTFVQFIPTQSYDITSQVNKDKDAEFVKEMIYNAVVREYMVKNAGTTFDPSPAEWEWKGDSFIGSSGGTYTLRDVATGDAGKDFGSVSVRCSGPIKSVPDHTSGMWAAIGSGIMGAASTFQQTVENVAGYGPETNPACLSEKASINAVYTSASAIADQIVTQNAASGAPQPSTPISDQIALAINTFHQAQKASSLTVAQIQGSELQRQQVDFANKASDLGWASSTFFYWKMANITQQASLQLKTLHPEVSPPDMENVRNSTGNSIDQYLKTTRDLIGYVDQKAFEKANQTYGMDDDSFGLSGLAASFITSITKGDPIISIAGWGNIAIDTGEAIITASVLSKVAMGAATGAAVGAEVGTVVEPGGGTLALGAGGGLIGGVAGAFKKVSTIVYAAAAFMIIEGVVGAYIIPSMPSMIMLAAVTGWIILVLEMLVAAPLWAAAHAYAEGEGLASQESKQGYAVAIGIIFRPVLITFGFIFAYILINALGRFTGLSLSMFFESLLAGSVVGPVAAVSIVLIALITVMMVLKQILNLTTHLADHVPKWMGGHGASLGETNSAQAAIHSAEGFAKGSGKAGVAYLAGKGVGNGTKNKGGGDDKPATEENPAANKGSTEATPDKPVPPVPEPQGNGFKKSK